MEWTEKYITFRLLNAQGPGGLADDPCEAGSAGGAHGCGPEGPDLADSAEKKSRFVVKKATTQCWTTFPESLSPPTEQLRRLRFKFGKHWH